jgi:hypothetical protein
VKQRVIGPVDHINHRSFDRLQIVCSRLYVTNKLTDYDTGVVASAAHDKCTYVLSPYPSPGRDLRVPFLQTTNRYCMERRVFHVQFFFLTASVCGRECGETIARRDDLWAFENCSSGPCNTNATWNGADP